MMDPLAALLNLADVESAVKSARAAVDGAYRHRTLRRKGGAVAAEISLRCAVASASLQSDGYQVEAVRSGTVLDPVVQGALRVFEELPTLASRWETAPRQVLARVHLLAGTGWVPPGQLGRPSAPVDRVCSYVLAKAGDPLIRAAVVHGELLALNAFGEVTGVVARAAGRLTLVASGLDPRGVIPVEEAHLARRPEYVGAAGAFATGTPDGMRSWLKHCANAVERGADSLGPIADLLT
jgi:hypothetical protein